LTWEFAAEKPTEELLDLTCTLSYQTLLENLLRPILIAVFLSLFLIPAQARLGETESQCIRRYGPVLSRISISNPGMTLPELGFVKNGYAFFITFFNGKVGLMTVQKTDQSELSDNEIDLLLTADSAGQKWLKQPIISPKIYWQRDDGSLAQYNPINHMLTLTSSEYINAKEAAKKSEEAKRMHDF